MGVGPEPWTDHHVACATTNFAGLVLRCGRVAAVARATGAVNASMPRTKYETFRLHVLFSMQKCAFRFFGRASAWIVL